MTKTVPGTVFDLPVRTRYIVGCDSLAIFFDKWVDGAWEFDDSDFMLAPGYDASPPPVYFDDCCELTITFDGNDFWTTIPGGAADILGGDVGGSVLAHVENNHCCNLSGSCVHGVQECNGDCIEGAARPVMNAAAAATKSTCSKCSRAKKAA
jgi:hypothetical protein